MMTVLLRIKPVATESTRLKLILELNAESELVLVSLFDSVYSPLLLHIRQILCAQRSVYIMLVLMIISFFEVEFRHVHMYDI